MQVMNLWYSPPVVALDLSSLRSLQDLMAGVAAAATKVQLVPVPLEDVCWRMLTYADVCWRMQVEDVPVALEELVLTNRYSQVACFTGTKGRMLTLRVQQSRVDFDDS
jgi:hypothetical protein